MKPPEGVTIQRVSKKDGKAVFKVALTHLTFHNMETGESISLSPEMWHAWGVCKEGALMMEAGV